MRKRLAAVARRLRAWTQADREERHDRAGRSAIYLGRGCVRAISIFLLFLVPAKAAQCSVMFPSTSVVSGSAPSSTRYLKARGGE